MFLAVSRVFRGIMGCSRGVPGLFRAVPGCSGGVPGCSGVFWGVPGCSGFYRHPLSTLVPRVAANNLRAECDENNEAKILRIEIVFATLKPAVKSETVECKLH